MRRKSHRNIQPTIALRHTIFDFFDQHPLFFPDFDNASPWDVMNILLCTFFLDEKSTNPPGRTRQNECFPPPCQNPDNSNKHLEKLKSTLLSNPPLSVFKRKRPCWIVSYFAIHACTRPPFCRFQHAFRCSKLNFLLEWTSPNVCFPNLTAKSVGNERAERSDTWTP